VAHAPQGFVCDSHARGPAFASAPDSAMRSLWLHLEALSTPLDLTATGLLYLRHGSHHSLQWLKTCRNPSLQGEPYYWHVETELA
jgi:hypothetical protein